MLSVRGWDRAVEFYKAAFSAREVYSVPGGGVGRYSVDGAEFWVAEESPPHLNFSPDSLGGSTARLLLIVEDPGAFCDRAVAAGAKLITPLKDEYGWRQARVMDPFGHHWEICRPLD
jgi:PhnB protein